jgi:hypothetical protein
MDKVNLHALPDADHLAAIAAAEETIRQRKAIMAERQQPVATPGEVDAVLRGLEGCDAH